ncbi:MAG: hypothetical protein HY785_21690 [Oscillatoriophycideae cyanobacterium NC_groundwater_1537_Pr4_S-0.65um_50_18]|nr:hypothetical protein [Oscillatoriophycideae cyanobacterium NC_groundwater_1537_Pr4_S-0.65um_50_18]
MHRILPIFILSVFGIAFAPLIGTLPSIAYRQQVASSNSVGASIHLEPNDTPQANQASPMQFVLTQRGGGLIPPESCACQVAIYNSANQTIAQNIPLSTASTKASQAIEAMITFPAADSYTVVLSGQSKDDTFQPFELIFPVIVRP